MISSVSLDHLEQAWQTLMPARPEGQPKGKARWNDGASRDKVLAKDVSHDDLFAVMKDFKHALGFECSDCHVKSATDPEKLEFSSNANPNKQVAIEMMKMVMEINRKHFGIKGPFAENYLGNKYQVTCYTCHHGGKEPATLAPVPPGEDH